MIPIRVRNDQILKAEDVTVKYVENVNRVDKKPIKIEKVLLGIEWRLYNYFLKYGFDEGWTTVSIPYHNEYKESKIQYYNVITKCCDGKINVWVGEE